MIADILPRYQVTSDGSTVAYTVPFELIENNLVNVYVDSEKQSSGYSVNVSAKTITFENAPDEGKLITIIRAIPISWEVSDFGSLNEESLNNALTLLTAKMQTLEEEISRSPKTNPYDKETGSDLSELFFTEMRDALDSLERAKVIYTQIQASGTQALADITTEKNSAISDIDDNSSDRIGEFNLNATNKTTAFNTNANTVTDTFNQNATNKTTAFNTNAAQKQAAVDASATAAATSASNAATSATNAATSETNAAATEARINETLSTYVTYVGDPTGEVTLKNKDDQTLIPHTELATANKAGRAKPDGTTTSVDSNGAISVIGKQDTLVSGTNIKTVDGKSLLGSGNLTVGIGYGTSTSAAADVQKEVSIPSITTLNEGQIIVVKPTVTASGANFTLKLNDFPAYPIRYNNAAITTSTGSIVWGANFPSQFIFDGDYWVFLGRGYDSNTTYTINYSLDAGKYTAGTGAYAVNRYALIAQKDDGTWERLTDTTKNYSTATTKTVNTRGFILNQLRYYGGTLNYGNGAKIATNVFYQKAASVIAAYSFNCSTAPGWAVGDYIYLVGTIGVDGLFYLDTTAWWSNALPSTNDGKLYIRLGLALTSTDATMSFFADRPIFYHDGTKICEYKVADNKQDTLVSGTNIKTVNGNSLLGSGDVAVQPTLVSGTNIKTINNTSLLGSGDVAVQPTLVSGTNIKTINNNSILGSGNLTVTAQAAWGSIIGTLSNQTDLQNALNAKQDIATAVNYANITNCITEIPQDIKLELNNGTLTLKAGSKVYVPNGFEQDGTTPKFDVVTVASDIDATTFGTSAQVFQILNPSNNNFYSRSYSQTCSGASPISGTYVVWYDTVNNLVKSTSDGGSTWTTGFALPISLATSDGHSYTSIDQVFNGFGYIGSTVFALPGVKGLIPNGRNADGTLKNIEITSSQVWTRTWQGNPNYNDLSLASSGIGINTNPYNEEENFVYNAGGAKVTDRVVFGKMEYNSSSPWNVTKLLVKTAFHAVDYNDLNGKVDKANFQVVTALPANPISGVFYFVKES